MLNCDVLVIGAGLAGLRAALAAAPEANVLVLSKVYPTHSHSVAAQGGINAAVSPDDQVDDHIFDTVKGSDYLGDQDAIAVLCREAPGDVLEMERWGLLFDRDDDGRIALRALGGAGASRACYVGDRTGHAMLHTVYERALRAGVRVLSEWLALELTVDSETGRCNGAVVWDFHQGRLEQVSAKAVILATGGYGRCFARTTNSHICTGDGAALAYRAGAVLADMEFVQFHPTTLAGSSILISEAARGDGGYLVNRDGERFMSRYAPEKMELAPRDVVSRSIQSELRAGRGLKPGDDDDYVLLDLRHLGERAIAERLPQIRELALLYAGVDLVHEPVPIQPGQHYSMGGVRTDVWGQTSLPGLYAAGECACVSVHGANRLGGNSLLETIVFGRRAGTRSAAEVASLPAARPDPAALTAAAEWVDEIRTGAAGPSVNELRRRLTALMTWKVGVFRVAGELEAAVAEIEELASAYAAVTLPRAGLAFNYALEGYLELGYLLTLSRLIACGALRRTESRGAHHRTDFPARDDDRWLAHTFVTAGEDGPSFTEGAIDLSLHAPAARGY